MTGISAPAVFNPGDVVLAALQSRGRPGHRCRPVVLVHVSKSDVFVRALYGQRGPRRTFIEATGTNGLSHGLYLSSSYCVLRLKSLKERLGALDTSVARAVVPAPREEPLVVQAKPSGTTTPGPPRRPPVNSSWERPPLNSEWNRIGRPQGDWWRDK
jgi:hypothetical protein